MGFALAFAVQFLHPTFPAKREQAEGAQRSEEWARPRPADAFVCSWVGVGSSPLIDGQLGALRGYPPLEWGGGEACFAARGKAFPLLIGGGLVPLPVLVNLPVLLILGELLLQPKLLNLLVI